MLGLGEVRVRACAGGVGHNEEFIGGEFLFEESEADLEAYWLVGFQLRLLEKGMWGGEEGCEDFVGLVDFEAAVHGEAVVLVDNDPADVGVAQRGGFVAAR